MNRKRVQRLMREDNLLCLRKRRFVVTTDSDHTLPVYPSLAREMILTGIDQLQVGRHHLHPYIRLEEEFVYLAEYVYLSSPGASHEWLTWRRSLNDCAPRLFQ